MPIARDAVIELCRRFIVTEHPVNRGTEVAPDWVVEYRPVMPTELTVRNLIRESLPRQAPVVGPEAARPPAEPVSLLPDDHPEVVAGRRRAARHAGTGSERLREEIEAGQRTAARYQKQAPAAGS